MAFVEVNDDVVNRILGITDETNIGEIIQSIVPLKKKGGKANVKGKEAPNKAPLITLYIEFLD